MSTPKPGRAVRGSRTGRPLMALLDLLGRRWALRVGWELRRESLPFRELQRRCGMPSPNILTTRLREGMETGTIERDPDGAYRLTPRGRSLVAHILPLDGWAKRWARELEGRKPGARRRR